MQFEYETIGEKIITTQMVDDNAISLMKINDAHFNQLMNDVNANAYNPKIMQSE